MENKLSTQIIEAAIEVHHLLGGPGLLESIYESALYPNNFQIWFWACVKAPADRRSQRGPYTSILSPLRSSIPGALTQPKTKFGSCLGICYELSLRGINTQRQLPIPVMYKNIAVRDPLFLDILVEEKVIIEVKATGKDLPFYQAQLLSHLRLANIPYGMLINFGKPNLREGISPLLNPSFVKELCH
jgi:GxxExxY protein